jgi:hypothetical protein
VPGSSPFWERTASWRAAPGLHSGTPGSAEAARAKSFPLLGLKSRNALGRTPRVPPLLAFFVGYTPYDQRLNTGDSPSYPTKHVVAVCASRS